MQKNCDRTILYSLIIEVSDSKENSRNNLEARNNVTITIEDALRPPIFFFFFLTLRFFREIISHYAQLSKRLPTEPKYADQQGVKDTTTRWNQYKVKRSVGCVVTVIKMRERRGKKKGMAKKGK